MNMAVEIKSNAAKQKLWYFALLNSEFEAVKCLTLSLVALVKLAVEFVGSVVCIHGKCEFQASTLCRPINQWSGKTGVNERGARAFRSLERVRIKGWHSPVQTRWRRSSCVPWRSSHIDSILHHDD